MASKSDERRPLLQEDEDEQSSQVKKTSYASVSVVPTDESVSASNISDAENAQAQSSGEDGNARMSKLIIPLGLGVFLAAMDQTIVASSFASIGNDLNELQRTSWVATGYMLTLTSFQPLYGKLSDIFGRKGCLLFAYAVFGIGCLLCGLARNMNELIAARALAGLGGGGMSTVVTILVSDIVPLRSRGTWQGILNIIFATGSATGAPLGGLLADSIGWRWAFLIQTPMTFLAFSIVSLALHLPAKDQALNSNFKSKLRRIDFLGALTLVSGVFALLIALDRGGNVSWTSSITLACLFAAFLFLSLFVLVETRIASEPFAPARVLAHPSLLAAFFCNLLGIGAAMCVTFHTALLLQAAHGATAAQAGLGLLPAIVGGVSGSLAGGLIMQRTGKYYWLTAGAYCAMVPGVGALVASTFFSSSSSTSGTNGLSTAIVTIAKAVGGSALGFALAEIGLAIMSLGNGTGITTTLIAIIANAKQEDQAIATAISYLFRSLGSVLGISLGSTLVQNTLRYELHTRLAQLGGGTDIDVEKIVAQSRASLASLKDLPPVIEAIVRVSYAVAVRQAFWFALVLAAGAAVSSFFVKEQPLTRKP